MIPRAFATCLAVALCGAAAGAPPADPWAMVPALPTGCYAEQDGFTDKIYAAKEAVTLAKTEQDQINSELKDKIQSIDPMELVSRQQQFMMEHPEEAMKLMQQNQQLSEQITDIRLQNAERRKALHQELQDLQTRYQAALDKELVPIAAKFADLDVRAQKDLVAVGETWQYAPWAVAEYNALVSQESAAYERVCSAWWPASGSFHDWLKREREVIAGEVPREEEVDLLGVGFMVQLVGTPTRSYKSTAALHAIQEYLQRAGEVFAKRRPRSRAPLEP